MERRAVDLWDFPNAWPPHQEIMTGSLLRCNELPEAFAIAKKIADAFLQTAYRGLFNPRRGMVCVLTFNIIIFFY
jgi:neutral trehalase